MIGVDLIATHLSSITTGYDVQKITWVDGNPPEDKIICFAIAGGGNGVDVNLDTQDIVIRVGGNNRNRQEFINKSNEIVLYLADNYCDSNVDLFEVISSFIGPIALSNNRLYFEINVKLHIVR